MFFSSFVSLLKNNYFHKAFGLVFWDYLEDIMGYIGFGRKWRSMIYERLSSSKLFVLINGSPSKEFLVRRGRAASRRSDFPLSV
jgi:hypothetical protein